MQNVYTWGFKCISPSDFGDLVYMYVRVRPTKWCYRVSWVLVRSAFDVLEDPCYFAWSKVIANLLYFYYFILI